MRKYLNLFADNKKLVYITIFGFVFLSCLILTITLNLSWLSFISAIFGILYVVFLSDRSVYNFLIGLVSTLTYTIITYRVQLYGEVIFYLLFDLPMIFVSYLFWKKHIKQTLVKPRDMNVYLKLLLFLFVLATVYLYSLFLNFLGGQFVLIDAASTILTIIATILMALRYREQWFMWILVYIISVIMWVAVFDILMLIMSSCCLVSCVVGYVNWRVTEKKENETDITKKM